jgi:hypothetical protein
LPIDDPHSATVLTYLVEKQLVSASTPRARGRYPDIAIWHDNIWHARGKGGERIRELPVYKTDVWLSEPQLGSTVGVPTPDNAGEIVELAHQLGLITRTKNNWTAAGYLVVGLRRSDPIGVAATNPMLLGLEAAALLRQVLRVDGLLQRHLVEELHRYGTSVRRDMIALELPRIAARALDDARALRRPPPEISEAKRFVELLRTTASERGAGSRAPGVLEHRTAPRLEWLTDLGALSKADLPKNSFEYVPTTDLALLHRLLSAVEDPEVSADELALAYWRGCSGFSRYRASQATLSTEDALIRGYGLMKRSVGPAPIRDVSFAAGLLSGGSILSHSGFVEALIEWASTTSGVTLSGGRFTRTPELVHVDPRILE